MNTEVTWQTQSTSTKQTEQIAAQLASNLRGGEVIELVSDLGGGKTAFVRGLARGLKSEDTVSSPTFTINQVYKGERLLINHYDFYRLGDDAGLMREELSEAMTDKNAVVVAEWGQSVADLLPEDRLRIQIKATDENTRDLMFTTTELQEYLLKDLQ